MTTARLIKKINTTEKGFTLIELLIVIGILAVLMGIVLVAINPAKQFAQANDTKRHSDINSILNAVDQYAADNKGIVPAIIPVNTPGDISSTGVDLCSLLVTTYIAALPLDPKTGTGSGDCSGPYDTKYSIFKSSTDNRVTVQATSEITGSAMTVTR